MPLCSKTLSSCCSSFVLHSCINPLNSICYSKSTKSNAICWTIKHQLLKIEGFNMVTSREVNKQSEGRTTCWVRSQKIRAVNQGMCSLYIVWPWTHSCISYLIKIWTVGLIGFKSCKFGNQIDRVPLDLVYLNYNCKELQITFTVQLNSQEIH